MNYKKLSSINDSIITGKFVVGNLNDYLNIINKTNAVENSKLSVEDFEQLESDYMGETLSYKVLSYKDKSSIKTIKINNVQYLNIYKQI